MYKESPKNILHITGISAFAIQVETVVYNFQDEINDSLLYIKIKKLLKYFTLSLLNEHKCFMKMLDSLK